MPRRWLSLLPLLCLTAVDPEPPGGGGGGAPGTTPPNPQPPATPPAAPRPPPAGDPPPDAAALRRAMLKDLGYDSEEAYTKAVEQRKKDEQARMSEAERHAQALETERQERTKAKAAADREKAERERLEAQLALRDLCDEQGVKPTKRHYVETARELAKKKVKAGETFDEAKFFEQLRKDDPGFFAEVQTTTTTTEQTSSWGTTAPAAPSASSTTTPAGGAPAVDAMKMNDEQWRAYLAGLS